MALEIMKLVQTDQQMMENLQILLTRLKYTTLTINTKKFKWEFDRIRINYTNYMIKLNELQTSHDQFIISNDNLKEDWKKELKVMNNFRTRFIKLKEDTKYCLESTWKSSSSICDSK